VTRLRDFAEGLVFGLPVHADERCAPHEILVGDREQIERVLAARKTVDDFTETMQRVGAIARATGVQIRSGFRSVYEQGAVARGLRTRTGQIARAWGEIGTVADDAFVWPEFNRPAFAALRCEVASTRKGLIS
jgi:hypothetical protein